MKITLTKKPIRLLCGGLTILLLLFCSTFPLEIYGSPREVVNSSESATKNNTPSPIITSQNVIVQTFVAQETRLRNITIPLMYEDPAGQSLFFEVMNSAGRVLASYQLTEDLIDAAVNIPLQATLTRGDTYTLRLTGPATGSTLRGHCCYQTTDALYTNTSGGQAMDGIMHVIYTYNILSATYAPLLYLVCLLSFFFFLFNIHLPCKVQRGFRAVLLLMASVACFIGVEILAGNLLDNLNGPSVWFWNSFFCLLVFGVLFGITRRPHIALPLGAAIILLFGCANYFVTQFRGSQLLPADLLSLSAAADVMNTYTYALSIQLLMAGAIFLLICSLCPHVYCCVWRKQKRGFILQGFCLVKCVCFLFFINSTLFVKTFKFSADLWGQITTSRSNGYLINFVANFSELGLPKPKGYSASALDKLAASYPSDSADFTGDKPNIIMIMNESLTDLESFADNLVTDREVLPFIHSLKNEPNVIFGQTVVASVANGGNTCTTEFSSLTGIDYSMLKSSSAFNVYAQRPLEALPKTLSTLGYQTVGFHPSTATNWGRNTAYPKLGFESISFVETLQNPDMLRGLVSDKGAYDFIINTFKKRDLSDPFFMFCVTMQNHGPYTVEWDAPTISILNARKSYPQAEQYLTLANASDAAFQSVIEYFENVDQKTIVLLYGDHLPHFTDGFLKDFMPKGISDKNSTEIVLSDALFAHFRTPFILWANYDIAPAPVDLGNISVQYIPTLLTEVAKLPQTGFMKYMAQLHAQYPVSFANIVQRADGTVEPKSQADLNNYRALLYNFLMQKTPSSIFSLADVR